MNEEFKLKTDDESIEYRVSMYCYDKELKRMIWALVDSQPTYDKAMESLIYCKDHEDTFDPKAWRIMECKRELKYELSFDPEYEWKKEVI